MPGMRDTPKDLDLSSCSCTGITWEYVHLTTSDKKVYLLCSITELTLFRPAWTRTSSLRETSTRRNQMNLLLRQTLGGACMFTDTWFHAFQVLILTNATSKGRGWCEAAPEIVSLKEFVSSTYRMIGRHAIIKCLASHPPAYCSSWKLYALIGDVQFA